MKIRAKTSFSGMITMGIGEVSDIEDDFILNDLLNAGYVEPAETDEGENPQTNTDLKDEKMLMTGTLDKEQLEKMTVPQLKAMAKEMGMDDSGRKAELIERISATEVHVDVENEAEGSDSE